MTTSQIGYEKAKRKASARNLEVYWMTFGVLAEVEQTSRIRLGDEVRVLA